MNLSNKEIEELLDSSYFSMNKRLMFFWGLWPYQSRYDRIWRQLLFVIIVLIFMSPHVWVVRMQCGKDIPMCASNLGPICFSAGVFTKMLVPIIDISKFRKAFEMIIEIWSTTTDSKVFEEYGKAGRRICIVYTVQYDSTISSVSLINRSQKRVVNVAPYFLFVGFAFSHFYMLPVALDYFFPLNETRDKLLILDNTEYPFSPFDYYFEYYVAYIIISLIVIFMVLATDTIYTAILYQCIATFAAAKHRLQKICTEQSEKKICGSIITAINLHKQALEFKELIDSIYQLPLLLVIGGSVGLLTVGSLCVVFLYESSRMEQIRLGFFGIGVIVQLLFITWPGHLLIVESDNIFTAVYNSKWYELPKKSTTMLKIIMQRCQTPCFLTVGRIYTINFENFGSVLRTVVSCITVALSLHK